jgi:hypothetical protein
MNGSAGKDNDTNVSAGKDDMIVLVDNDTNVSANKDDMNDLANDHMNVSAGNDMIASDNNDDMSESEVLSPRSSTELPLRSRYVVLPTWIIIGALKLTCVTCRVIKVRLVSRYTNSARDKKLAHGFARSIVERVERGDTFETLFARLSKEKVFDLLKVKFKNGRGAEEWSHILHRRLKEKALEYLKTVVPNEGDPIWMVFTFRAYRPPRDAGDKGKAVAK